MVTKPKFVPRSVTSDMATQKPTSRFVPKSASAPDTALRPTRGEIALTGIAGTQGTPLPRTIGSLFPRSGVGPNVPIEPFYKNHPLCKGLNTHSLSRIRHLYNETDLEDSKTTLGYGEDLRNKFGTIIDKIIAETTGNSKYSEITTKIVNILELTKALDIDTILNPPAISMWDVVRGRATKDDYAGQDRASTMIAKFHSSLVKLEVLTADLSNDIHLLIKRVDMLDELFEANKDNFEDLNLYVIAGKMILAKQQKEVIPYKQSKLKNDDLFKVNEFEYYKDSVNRFERKVEDLQVTSVSMLQQVQQIRMMQVNSKNLAEMVQRVNRNNIPNWKIQCNALMDFMQDTREESLAKVRQQIATKGSQLLERLKDSQKSVALEFTK